MPIQHLALSRRLRPARSVLTLAALLALSGAALAIVPPQAVAQAASAAPATPPAAGASAPAGAKPVDPAAPKPFADVSRDATRTDGFVPFWRKEEKVWLEIAPEQLNKPFLLTANIAQSVGERGLYASQMGPDWMVEWRRIGNLVQLVALNNEFRPGADTASRESVRQAFSESLIGSAAVASAPHPERKSFLIDASFLLADLVG